MLLQWYNDTILAYNLTTMLQTETESEGTESAKPRLEYGGSVVMMFDLFISFRWNVGGMLVYARVKVSPHIVVLNYDIKHYTFMHVRLSYWLVLHIIAQ